MANISRIRCAISGAAVVGPGVSTFYVRDSIQVLDSADFTAFWDACKAFFPTSWTVTIPGSGDTINDATGELTGTWGSTGGAQVTGTSTDQFVLGVGCRIRWSTNGIFQGRRVRGSTFMVPLPATKYAGAGAIGSDVITAFNSAASGLIAATSNALVIWSRPTTPGGSNGTSNVVTSGTTPDAVSWLRSRRV